MALIIHPRAPHYPIYQTTSNFLELANGIVVKTLSELLKQIDEHKGTPQANNDWSNPDVWIDELLSPEVARLAHHFWDNEKLRINPRYIGDQLRFVKMYDLLLEEQNKYQVSPKGKEFLKGNSFEELDYIEGIIKLLSLVADLGSGKRKDFLEPFGNFLKEHSNIKSNTVIDSYWYYRMRNLVYRGYVQNLGSIYQITDSGLKYLQSVSGKLEAVPSISSSKPLLQLQKLQLEQTKEVRQQIADALANMNPYAFEAFVGQLLQAIGYQNVIVTQKSNDKGVDVIAEIEVGITLVKEVVQVKRYNKSTVGDKEVNELRGRLPRFGAIRGTIITNSRFSKAAQESAFLGAPITLIDGERLISLMLENGIGVEYEEIKIPKFNPEDFDFDAEDIENL